LVYVPAAVLREENLRLRRASAIATVLASALYASAVLAQAPGNEQPSPGQGAACPPDVRGEPPTVGGGSSEPLSDKLAQSKGVICPPANVDRDMEVAPSNGGRLKIIPPPGTPGGEPGVQPR
jgi:hypothetical protein